MARLNIPTSYRDASPGSTSPTSSAVTSGVRNVMRLIGETRPVRFLPRAASVYEGRNLTAGLTETAHVTRIQPLSDTELWSVQTSTRTLVADGLLSHNCVQGSAYDILAETLIECRRQGLDQHVQLCMHDEIVCDTEAAPAIREIMATPPDRLTFWSGREIRLRTDMADMGHSWASV